LIFKFESTIQGIQQKIEDLRKEMAIQSQEQQKKMQNLEVDLYFGKKMGGNSFVPLDARFVPRDNMTFVPKLISRDLA
jgi:hypothetical protein